jgi:hypothetical protein
VRILKIFAIGIFLIGILYLGVGAWILFTFESTLQVMELAQRSEMKEAQSFDPNSWPAGFIFNGVMYTVVGALTLVSATGLFRAREWARRMWLGVTILFALLHLFWLMSHYRSGLIDRGDSIGLGVVSAVVVGSWVYLTKPSTVTLFQRDVDVPV